MNNEHSVSSNPRRHRMLHVATRGKRIEHILRTEFASNHAFLIFKFSIVCDTSACDVGGGIDKDNKAARVGKGTLRAPEPEGV